MAPIPFPTTSAPGAQPQEGAGRIINGFAQQSQDGARFPLIWRRSAGLQPFVTIPGATNSRGLHFLFDTTALHVVNDKIYSIILSGGTTPTATLLGSLPGSRLVTIASNNKMPTPNIVCVT